MGKVSIHGSEYAVGKVFSDEFAFHIPLYQRPYSWTNEHVGELLDDLLTFIQNEGNIDTLEMNPYFLGSIVLIKGEEPDSQIVDGQQRLVTMTILLSALRQLIGSGDAKSITKFIYEEGNSMTGTPDRYRLTMREKDASFFQEYIQDNGGILKLHEVNPDILSETKKNIMDNAIYILSILENLPEYECTKLAKFLINRCFLVVVTTPDFDSAYRIFSILNDRGLDLSHTDILKADIIGKIPFDQQESYAEKWDITEEMLGREIFQELFAHIRMIYRKGRSKDTILKEIRQYIKPDSNPQNFINNVLEPYANSFYSIKYNNYLDINRLRENTNQKKIGYMLSWLNRIDNSDWLPPAILFHSLNRNKPDQLIRFFSDLERLAAGLMIQRMNINKRIERYGRLLTAIQNEDSLYSNDSPLQLTPQERRSIRNTLNREDFYLLKNVPRYVLLRLDGAMSEGTATYDEPIVTVEHVLPQNPPENSAWNEWFPTPKDHSKYVNRLGNLVLLSRKKNSSANNYDFSKKKEKYFATSGGISPFVLTMKVLDLESWTPNIIDSRQEEMLKVAKTLWRL
ncbi:MAG: DUF262 domain-containing protein [Methanotrichaceae archaeon]|nr:DUF262 domain-containing protein [Methanotrichaceae archaeon]